MDGRRDEIGGERRWQQPCFSLSHFGPPDWLPPLLVHFRLTPHLPTSTHPLLSITTRIAYDVCRICDYLYRSIHTPTTTSPITCKCSIRRSAFIQPSLMSASITRPLQRCLLVKVSIRWRHHPPLCTFTRLSSASTETVEHCKEASHLLHSPHCSSTCLHAVFLSGCIPSIPRKNENCK